MEDFLSSLIIKLQYLGLKIQMKGNEFNRKTMLFSSSDDRNKPEKIELCEKVLRLCDKIKLNCDAFKRDLIIEASRFNITLNYKDVDKDKGDIITMKLDEIIPRNYNDSVCNEDIEKFNMELKKFAANYWEKHFKENVFDDTLEKQLEEIFGSDTEQTRNSSAFRKGEKTRLAVEKESQSCDKLAGSEDSNVSIETILKEVEDKQIEDTVISGSLQGACEEVMNNEFHTSVEPEKETSSVISNEETDKAPDDSSSNNKETDKAPDDSTNNIQVQQEEQAPGNTDQSQIEAENNQNISIISSHVISDSGAIKDVGVSENDETSKANHGGVKEGTSSINPKESAIVTEVPQTIADPTGRTNSEDIGVTTENESQDECEKNNSNSAKTCVGVKDTSEANQEINPQGAMDAEETEIIPMDSEDAVVTPEKIPDSVQAKGTIHTEETEIIRMDSEDLNGATQKIGTIDTEQTQIIRMDSEGVNGAPQEISNSKEPEEPTDDNYDKTMNVRDELMDLLAEVDYCEEKDDEIMDVDSSKSGSDSDSSALRRDGEYTSKHIKRVLKFLNDSDSCSASESVDLSGDDYSFKSDLSDNIDIKIKKGEHSKDQSPEDSCTKKVESESEFSPKKCKVQLNRENLVVLKQRLSQDSSNVGEPSTDNSKCDNVDSPSCSQPIEKEKVILKDCYVKLVPIRPLRLSSGSDSKSSSDDEKEINRLCNLSNLSRTKPSKNSPNSRSDRKHTRLKRKRRKLQDSGSETSDLTGFSSVSEDEIKKERLLDDNDDNDDNNSILDPNTLLSEIICHTIHDSDSETSSSESDAEVKERKKTIKGAQKFKYQGQDKKSKNGEEDSWRNDPLLTTNLNFRSDVKSENRKTVKKRKKCSSNDSDSSDGRKRRRKRLTYYLDPDYDSDTSSHGSDSSHSDKEKKETKNIKTDDDNSDIELVDINSPSKSSVIKIDSDEEDRKPGTGRRNILSLLSYASLTQETQKAAQEEKERLQQLEMKKQKRNTQSQSQAEVEEGIVLDTSSDGYKITVDAALSKRMFPHQVQGVQFMWDACYLSVDSLKTFEGTGCILAHNMGLGKTFQVVALVHTLFSHSITNTKHVLIVCPLSTVSGWKKEFQNGVKIASNKITINIIHIDSSDSFDTKFGRVNRWKNKGGVLIVGYEALSKLSSKKDTKRSEFLRQALVDPGPSLVVCDEGHLLKNGNAMRTKTLMEIKTKRRIALTGTPLQNNLTEYYYMVQFVKPNLLGTKHEFNRQFVNPIINGQYEDSVEADITLMKKRTHVLHRLLKNTVQRYEASELNKYLQTMKDYALFIQLHPLQEQLYRTYLLMSSDPKNIKLTKGMRFFNDFQVTKYICSHPQLLYTMEEQNAQGKKKVVKETDVIIEEPEVQEFDGIPEGWWKSICPEETKTELEFGTKLLVMMGIIEEAEKTGDKVLIFTSSRIELSSIEYFLKLKGTPKCPSWREKRDYFRMDGTVSPSMRTSMCELFNDEKNRNLRVFLMSHKVGGLGLNLVSANRIILLGSNFNPSLDTQSIFRAYRFGQNKCVYIYRLISMGTMEEKIYHRCVTKLAIASRVVDKHQIARHYKNLDLEDVYRVSIDLSQVRPTPLKPDDDLLANVLLRFECIHKYHQHQKLLENRPDEDLNEEDKRKAWEEFERMSEKATAAPGTEMPNNIPGTSGVSTILQNRWNQLNPATSNIAQGALPEGLVNYMKDAFLYNSLHQGSNESGQASSATNTNNITANNSSHNQIQRMQEVINNIYRGNSLSVTTVPRSNTTNNIENHQSLNSSLQQMRNGIILDTRKQPRHSGIQSSTKENASANNLPSNPISRRENTFNSNLRNQSSSATLAQSNINKSLYQLKNITMRKVNENASVDVTSNKSITTNKSLTANENTVNDGTTDGEILQNVVNNSHVATKRVSSSQIGPNPFVLHAMSAQKKEQSTTKNGGVVQFRKNSSDDFQHPNQLSGKMTKISKLTTKQTRRKSVSLANREEQHHSNDDVILIDSPEKSPVNSVHNRKENLPTSNEKNVSRRKNDNVVSVTTARKEDAQNQDNSCVIEIL